MRRFTGSILVGSLLAILLFGLTVVATAQERWQWPEHPKNLQVLPKDMTGEQLRPVMIGFTRALGVRCAHCHVGKEGEPLSTYDFPADDNPNKNRAREMLRMLKDINAHLAKIEPSAPVRVNMWCGTCHRGRPRPTTLVEELRAAYTDGGAGAAIAHYKQLRDRYYGRGTVDFSERPLNEFGYELLGKDDVDGAIAMLRLNAEQFPQSGNVWDSLAEAYLKAGRTELATIYYRKSLELDPDNENALAQLKKLAGEE